MNKRVNKGITKKIKTKFGLNLREYAEKKRITLASLKAFISGTRNNTLVWSVLVADEIINSTHSNNKNKGYKYEQL